jgi:uncharacterized protein YjiK
MNKLIKLLSECGNVIVINMNNNIVRVKNRGELGDRVNWVKMKKILDKENIEYIDGNNGYNRCIDFKK